MKKYLLTGMTFAASMLVFGEASAQVKIGVGAPITGTNASFGAQYVNGAKQAAEDINAQGGVLGQKIQIVVGDDKSDPREGVKVASKFIDDGVTLVDGHFNSGVSIPASQVYADNDVLMVTPGSTTPMVTERGLWNAFRVCGRDDQQGAVAAAYIATNLQGKKIAIAHDRTTYGKGLADETLKALNARGIKEVLYEGVNAGEKDYSALVQKVKASGADILYWGGLHTEGGLIVRQMREQGVSTALMGGDGLAPDEFAKIAGPGAEGTLMTFAPDPRATPDAKKVVAEFKAKKINPEFYTLYSYATVQIIAEAAKRANSLDPHKIASDMRTGKPYDTILGPIAFNQKGDVTHPAFVVYRWTKSGDKILPVEINKGS